MAVDGVDLEVRAGEIVAIAGVQGNGQTELVEAIVGLRTIDSGEITIGGHHTENASPREISDLGVAHIPEDRGRDGLINYMSVAENYILDTYHREPYSRRGVLNLEAVNERAAQGVKDFDIRTPSIHTLATALSGGNQQKVVVAREFSVPVQLAIAAQPTRGLDVGAIEFVHRRLVDERDEGRAILLVSFELDEILSLSDRILVLYEGKIVGEYAPDVSEEELGIAMTGGRRGAEAEAVA
jgi:simple sugar transport system ATP-binding protein